MRARITLSALVVALLAGCGTQAAPAPVTVAPVAVTPANVAEVTEPPAAVDDSCDVEASLRPTPLPPPGAMPAGSTMARIAERGILIVGVDQNQFRFGYRNPDTQQLEGFDIDVAREMAQAIFGDPNRIQFVVVTGAERQEKLQSGEVDLVVRTYSITCERKEQVAFSTAYFYADQELLVLRDSGIRSPSDLEGKRACAVKGTTSVQRLWNLNPRPTVLTATTWTDCLVMLQQGQIDAIGTDSVVLVGLAEQDALNVEVIGPSVGQEPYGVGVNKEDQDLVRFVNGVLDRMRTDGTWEALYNTHLRAFGPSPGPPVPRYVN